MSRGQADEEGWKLTTHEGGLGRGTEENADDADDLGNDSWTILASGKLGRDGTEQTTVLVSVRTGGILCGQRRQRSRQCCSRKVGRAKEKTYGKDQERKAASS